MRNGILISGLLLAGACGGSDSTSTPPVSHNKTWDVFTVGEGFIPPITNIVRGDTVRFNIVPAPDGDGHDVTFKATPGAPPSIPVTKNAVISLVFTTAGTFHYDCFVHPGMSGDVIVQ